MDTRETFMKINLIAPIGTTGYGVTGYNLLKQLDKQGHEVSLFVKGQATQRIADDDWNIISAAIGRSKHSFDPDAPCINLWHQFDLALRVGRGKYYGFPIFELDKFNDIELHHLKCPHELIVCSHWAKDVLRDNGIQNPVHVVPLGIDPYIFTPALCKDEGGPTVFLNVGKWEVRKGHDFIWKVFNDAFSPDDNVELWMMPHNPFLKDSETKEWENLYLKSPMGVAGKIKILPWVDTHRDLAKVMSQATCGLFPARAEGWNLELLEMMALGKPVITTNYSGHTEFCTPSNSLLIQTDENEDAFDGKWFHGQGQWAYIGDSEMMYIGNHMRRLHNIHQHPDQKSINNPDGIATGEQFTWANSAEILAGILDN